MREVHIYLLILQTSDIGTLNRTGEPVNSFSFHHFSLKGNKQAVIRASTPLPSLALMKNDELRNSSQACLYNSMFLYLMCYLIAYASIKSRKITIFALFECYNT